MTSATEHRNSDSRALLLLFSKTVTVSSHNDTLSQMGSSSTSYQQTIITYLCQRHIILVATIFHRMQLLKWWTERHSDYVYTTAQFCFSKFPAWQLDFHFYLATTSHPKKAPSPVLKREKSMLWAYLLFLVKQMVQLLEDIFVKHGVGLKVAAFSGHDVTAQHSKTLL